MVFLNRSPSEIRKNYKIPEQIEIHSLNKLAEIPSTNSTCITIGQLDAGLKIPLYHPDRPLQFEVLRLLSRAPGQMNGNFYRIISAFEEYNRKNPSKRYSASEIVQLHSESLAESNPNCFFIRKHRNAVLPIPDVAVKNDSSWYRFPISISGDWIHDPKHPIPKGIPYNPWFWRKEIILKSGIKSPRFFSPEKFAVSATTDRKSTTSNEINGGEETDSDDTLRIFKRKKRTERSRTSSLEDTMLTDLFWGGVDRYCENVGKVADGSSVKKTVGIEKRLEESEKMVESMVLKLKELSIEKYDLKDELEKEKLKNKQLLCEKEIEMENLKRSYEKQLEEKDLRFAREKEIIAEEAAEKKSLELLQNFQARFDGNMARILDKLESKGIIKQLTKLKET
ncbi:hypothetical protein MKW94_017544 [Papaver nudicaule]|uniref:Uncharacterized protein n=1 Tax=Papaver nudicaule TaxID=74823 RepID=A0AA41VRD9_PAPNU|nr:hypothetical protein [Papaver nudicaule]